MENDTRPGVLEELLSSDSQQFPVRRIFTFRTLALLLPLVSYVFINIMHIVLRTPDLRTIFMACFFLISAEILLAAAIRSRSKEWKDFPRNVLFMITFATVLPVLFHDFFLIIFLSVLSLTMFNFGNQFYSRSLVISSAAVAIVMVLALLGKLIVVYLPAFLAQKDLVPDQLVIDGIIMGILVTSTLIFLGEKVKQIKFRLSHKFHRKDIGNDLSYALFISLYISLAWVWLNFAVLITKSELLLPAFWFIFHCLFLVVFIETISLRRSEELNIIIMLGLISLIALFIFINPLLVEARNLILNKDNGILKLCFFELAFFSIIAFLIAQIVYLNDNKINKQRALRYINRFLILTLGFITILAASDHLAVLLNYSHYTSIDSVIENNHHLTWSLIIFALSAISLVYSRNKNLQFLPQFSFVLLLASLGKMIAYDQSVYSIPMVIGSAVVMIFVSKRFSKPVKRHT